jgi:hypothetical protein
MFYFIIVNGNLNWCSNVWINWYNNIPNVLWEYLNQFETNIIST